VGIACLDCLAVGPGVDLDRHAERVLWRGAMWLELSPRQYAGLRYLAEHRGHPVRAQDLGEAVWGAEAGHPARRAQTLVRRLRARLEEDPRQPRVILTVVGEGYLIPS
jgi:DNA-binding response OmpR family regulator